METPNTKYNGKLIVIPNPDIDDNWIRKFTDGWKELEHTPLVWEVPKINNTLSDTEIALHSSFKALNKIWVNLQKCSLLF